MYRLSPPAVYAHESVVADARYRARLERVVAALAEPCEPIVYGDDDLPGLVRGRGILENCVPMGTLETVPDAILMFNTFRFDGRRDERQAALRRHVEVGYARREDALTGAGAFAWFKERIPENPTDTARVCRPCWRLHMQCGCVHKCHYCSLGGLLVAAVNVEEYVEHLDDLIRAHPWQETYLLEDDADVLCLEPELGCLAPIIEYFGTLTGRYLIIHTKSANVDWMLDLKHNGNTIVVWSLAGRTQAERFEPVTGGTAERIEAAHRAEAAGYVVRYKFKPIIPVTGWRQEGSDAVRLLFERTAPDVVSLCVFMWTDADEMKRRLAAAPLEEEFVAAAEAAADDLVGVNARPFPHEVRAAVYDHYLREIRRWNADVPVSLSTETLGMWKEFAPKLGAGPFNYVCGCGPNATPGRRRLPCHPYRNAHPAEGTAFQDL